MNGLLGVGERIDVRSVESSEKAAVAASRKKGLMAKPDRSILRLD